MIAECECAYRHHLPLSLGAEIVHRWDTQHDSIDGYRNLRLAVERAREILIADEYMGFKQVS